jgi:hypothetical protein
VLREDDVKRNERFTTNPPQADNHGDIEEKSIDIRIYPRIYTNLHESIDVRIYPRIYTNLSASGGEIRG